MIHFHTSAGQMLAIQPRSVIAVRTCETGSTELHLTSGAVFHVQEPIGDVLDKLPSRLRNTSGQKWRELVDG